MWMWMLTTYNLRRLRELESTSEFSYKRHATDSAVGAHSRTEENQVLHNLKKLPTQKTHGLPIQIILQEGIRYTITSNIDVSDGLFNGATGILKFVEIIVDESSGKRDVKFGAAYLEFDDPKVGRKARHIISNTPAIKSTWTPIDRMELSFKVSKKVNAQVKISMHTKK
jgi:hypothetical protein